MTPDRDWATLFERAASYDVTVTDVEHALRDHRAGPAGDDARDAEDDAAE